MMSRENIPVGRILIIDDNAAIHEDFRKILMKTQTLDDSLLDVESALFGSEIQIRASAVFELDSAFQGREGPALVRKALSEGRPYSLAFVDGRMPPGWDGIETIHHLWQECPDLQVVLCTAYADYSWLEICRVLGETDNLLILKKPFDDVEVLQIAHALNRKWELSREVQDRIMNLDDMVQKKTEEKDYIRAMLETALDHSPAGIIITDTHDAAIRWANPEALRILGEGLLFCPTNQGMTPDGDWQAIRPDGTAYASEDLPLSRAMVQGEIIRNEECIIRNAEGHEKWIASNAAPVRDANGLISAGILIFEDITERKQSEEALIKSEALLKLIIEHTSAFVSIHDSAGNYIFASPSHEQLGFKPEELIGQSGFAMIESDDIGVLLEYLSRAGRKEISEAFLDYKVRDKGGGIHYLRGSFNAVFKPDGGLERIICVGEDISELRKAQTEKIEAFTLAAEARKLALVGQIAGKMAHDFNNILGVIMGNSELALMACPHIQTRKSLELILEQTLRGKNLTRNLVAFAKDHEPKQEFFNLDEKIELVVDLLKKDLEKIPVIREYSPDVPELLADPGMIEHALVNLIQNSIHAVSLARRPKIIIRTHHRNGRIVMEIEDNGCGIPPEHLGKIFDPAFTLKGSKDKGGMYKAGIKGTGYGMSNVKKYIEQHKGEISIHSKPKKGTRVTISLPVTKKMLTEEEVAEVKKEKFCFGKYILLVEDEQAISDIQYRILTHDPLNHKVDIAGNGKEALGLLDRNVYDLISLDYLLPGKLNGMDIYHHIRETNKIVPVLFISGNIEFLESIEELKKKDLYMDHLSKPCKNVDYINGINMLFGRTQSL